MSDNPYLVNENDWWIKPDIDPATEQLIAPYLKTAEIERLRAEITRLRAGIQAIATYDGWWDGPSLARDLLGELLEGEEVP